MKGGTAVAFIKKLLTVAALAVLFAAMPATAQDMNTCKQCHQDKVDGMARTLHGKSGLSGSPAATQGCQSCHGDASAHVKASGGTKVGLVRFSDKTASADTKSEKCLTCHGANRQFAYWESGKHKVQDVTCADCHNIHGTYKGAKINSILTTSIVPNQSETCFTCHKTIRSDANKPSHHPIVEGKIKCSDCHNPHGAPGKGMIKTDSVNQLCTTCHAEKRGPFIWEHPPVEENCLTCHFPHGSNTTKLLVEKMPHLCADCHEGTRHPTTLYGAGGAITPNSSAAATTAANAGRANNTRMFARSCMNCHNEIHGSNGQAYQGRRFFR